ncbi:MAG: response regulator [Bacteriovoracaceae bacterium]|nr:response regulator [Bacteriovoracaceae bacterium]
MTAKILVADDSLTIQKVVGITLAETGYELEQCKNETDLFDKISVRKYDLILLDFNLSESKSGYDLAKEILNISPGVNILVMLGTFDSVDENQLEQIGVNDKIVKPFESAKFVQKCTDIIDSSFDEDDEKEESVTDEAEEVSDVIEDEEEQTEEISLSDEETEIIVEPEPEMESDSVMEEEVLEEDIGEKTEEIQLHTENDDFNESEDLGPEDEEVTEEVDLQGTSDNSGLEEGADYFKQEADEELTSENDGWVVDSPSQEDESLLDNSGGLWEEDSEKTTSEISGSTLNNEIESWGMSIPGVIGGPEDNSLFPPVISSSEDTSSELVNLEDLGSEIESELIEEVAQSEPEPVAVQASEEDEIKVPDNSDLDYPDLGGSSMAEEPREPKSKLVSMDDLAPDDGEDDDEELDATDPLILSRSADEQSDLANEIDSEVSPDEFWAVDDKKGANQDLTISEYVEGAGANPDMVDSLETKGDYVEPPREEKTEPKAPQQSHEEVVEIEIDKDEIIESIKESLKPMIEDLVREMCRDKVEQVAWEVIPDLAENLIKKEIRDISESIN